MKLDVLVMFIICVSFFNLNDYFSLSVILQILCQTLFTQSGSLIISFLYYIIRINSGNVSLLWKKFELFFVWMFYITAIIVPKSTYVWMKYKNNPLLHSKGLQTNTHYEQGFVM